MRMVATSAMHGKAIRHLDPHGLIMSTVHENGVIPFGITALLIPPYGIGIGHEGVPVLEECSSTCSHSHGAFVSLCFHHGLLRAATRPCGERDWVFRLGSMGLT